MESIKYSDLVIDDGAIQKLIAELGNLRATYEKDVQAIIAACKEMKGAINSLGGSGGGGAALASHASEVDKLKAKYDELNERYKKNDLAIEQYKARIAELQQQMKAEAKAQLENSQMTAQAKESYYQLAATYTRLKIELNKYSQAEIDNNKVLAAKQKQALETREAMKRLQEATGNHTLDVGNYSKALNGLGLATQQIVREAPSLAMSFNQFFLAISNNIPIFTDAFKRVKEEMGSTKIALMQTLKSFFSWQTALVIALTLLAKFGNEVVQWASKFLSIGGAFNAAAEGLKLYNEAMAKVSGQAAENAAELETYIYVLEHGNKSEKEQAEIVRLVNERFGKQLEYLGLTIDSTQSLIDAKGKLIELLVREAEARGILNEITSVSGEIAKREASEEYTKLVEAVEAAKRSYDVAKSLAGATPAGNGYAGLGAAANISSSVGSAKAGLHAAQEELKEYNDETQKLINLLERLRERALGLDFGTLLGGGSGSGGSPTKAVRNRDLEFIRAAEDAALKATQDNIFKETEAIRLEYTRRIEDLRTYLAEQRALEEDKREITVAGETAILNQIKSLHLVMDREIADAWYDMLNGQLDDLTRTLDAETAAFAKALDDMDKKALKSSLGKDIYGDSAAEKRAQLKYKQRQSEVKLETFGDKDAQTKGLRAAEIEYKTELLEIWQRDARKTTYEVEALRNEIELLKKEQEEEGEMSWFEKLEKQIEEKLGKKGLSKITKAVQQAANYVMEQFQAIAQARVDLANTMVEQAQRELDATKTTLDQEIIARANGYANNVALAHQEYLEKQRIQEQALAEQRAAVEAQNKLNTVQQVVSLVTASANIFSSLSTIPMGIGIPIAIALIATMFGAFAAAKVQANQLTAQTYGEGGTELLSGGSHQSGRDIPLGTMPDGRERRAEGGEYLAIINKRSSRKYGGLIPSVVDALNSGVFEQKFGNAFKGDALVVNVDGSTDAIERFHRDMKAAMGRKSETRLADGTRIITYGNTKKIIRS